MARWFSVCLRVSRHRVWAKSNFIQNSWKKTTTKGERNKSLHAPFYVHKATDFSYAKINVIFTDLMRLVFNVSVADSLRNINVFSGVHVHSPFSWDYFIFIHFWDKISHFIWISSFIPFELCVKTGDFWLCFWFRSASLDSCRIIINDYGFLFQSISATHTHSHVSAHWCSLCAMEYVIWSHKRINHSGQQTSHPSFHFVFESHAKGVITDR